MVHISTEEVLEKIKNSLEEMGKLYLTCLAGAFIVIWLTSGFAMSLAVIIAFLVGAASSHATDLKKLRTSVERDIADAKKETSNAGN